VTLLAEPKAEFELQAKKQAWLWRTSTTSYLVKQVSPNQYLQIHASLHLIIIIIIISI
jgi:hypothetical protein